MGKLAWAFITGFSLAMFIVFLTFFIYLTPMAGMINTSYQVNEQIYLQTHSGWYAGASSFLTSVKGWSSVPIIGELAQYGGSIGDFMVNVKQASESLQGVLGLIKFLTDASLIATILFLVLFVIGLIKIKSGSNPSHPATSASTEKSKFCSQCGTKNVFSAKFCESCGVKI
ncbi:MAG: hypothetical protein Q7S92_02355 [Candidatus Diapherotrites archaeon]|nr:hypothetical protein [Candidatus Diapherotrites archaeon]